MQCNMRLSMGNIEMKPCEKMKMYLEKGNYALVAFSSSSAKAYFENRRICSPLK